MARVAKKVVTKTKATKKAARPAGTKQTVDLDAIGKAIAGGDGGAALAAALEAWRGCRAAPLAELIDAISQRISPPAVTVELDWTRLASSGSPVALGALLAGVRELPVSFLPEASKRLSAFPDDPRIAAAACDWILDPPCMSSSAYPFWTQLYDTLARIGDRRPIAAANKRVAMQPPGQAGTWAKGKPSKFWGRFYTALDKTRAKLEALDTPEVARATIDKLISQTKKLGAIAIEATAPAAAKRESGPPLPRALAHAKAGRVGPAIDALLEAWRDHRAPELADLIDRATRLLPAFHHALPAEPKAAHAAWQAAFARDPIAELPSLLLHLHAGGASAATEHVVELSTLPDDPRIALRLAELSPHYTISPERTQYWKTSWEVIARTRDVRVIPSLRQHFDDFQGTYYDHHRQGKRIAGGFVLGEVPVFTFDVATVKTLQAIGAALQAIELPRDRQERDLIAECVRQWDDEGPRLVYADWLIEHEHPRGHLIVLECKIAREGKLSGAEGKLRRQLTPSFRSPTYLYGALDDIGTRFDRGLPFAVEAKYQTSGITFARLVDDPLLPCLTELGFEDAREHRGRPVAADLARLMLAAPRLARVTDVPEDLRGRLASELEPLVRDRWKRSGQEFTRR